MHKKYQWIAFALLFFLTSCNQNQQVKDSQLALIKTTNPNPVITDHEQNKERVKEIKDLVSSLPELYDVAVIQGKNGTLVAYKVKHLQRFKMKKIEKRVTNLLEERYPKEKFTVSSDYKIFLEVVRLDEKMQANNISRKDADKRFNEIVRMTEDIK